MFFTSEWMDGICFGYWFVVVSIQEISTLILTSILLFVSMILHYKFVTSNEHS